MNVCMYAFYVSQRNQGVMHYEYCILRALLNSCKCIYSYSIVVDSINEFLFLWRVLHVWEWDIVCMCVCWFLFLLLL